MPVTTGLLPKTLLGTTGQQPAKNPLIETAEKIIPKPPRKRRPMAFGKRNKTLAFHPPGE